AGMTGCCADNGAENAMIARQISFRIVLYPFMLKCHSTYDAHSSITCTFYPHPEVTTRTDREAVIEATGLIILSSCAFGSLSTLTVLVNRSGLPLIPAMLWRYLIAAGILLVILRHQRQLIIPRKDAVRLMLTGGLAQ